MSHGDETMQHVTFKAPVRVVRALDARRSTVLPGVTVSRAALIRMALDKYMPEPEAPLAISVAPKVAA
jgi:hypothetical protein